YSADILAESIHESPASLVRQMSKEPPVHNLSGISTIYFHRVSGPRDVGPVAGERRWGRSCTAVAADEVVCGAGITANAEPANQLERWLRVACAWARGCEPMSRGARSCDSSGIRPCFRTAGCWRVPAHLHSRRTTGMATWRPDPTFYPSPRLA